MNKGDVVKVLDGSYSVKITDNGLEAEYGINLEKEGQIVVETGLSLPASTYLSGRSQRNDTILRGVDSGQITFIKLAFCRPVKQFCEYCGQRLEKCEIEH